MTRAETAFRWLDRLLLLELVTLTFVLGCFLDKDADIWWHLRAGLDMLAGGGIPRHDAFLFSSAGAEWIDLHWGFQLLAGLIFKSVGFAGLTIAAAIAAALGVAVALTATTRRRSVAALAWCWLPAIFVMSARFYPRPEILSLVCLAAVLLVIHSAETQPSRLWWLVPIQLVWVNVHGLFILGPVIVACWVLDRVIHGAMSRAHAGWRHRWGAPAAVLVACLFNPYFWKGAIFPLTLFRRMSTERDFYGQHIGELLSIPELVARTGFSSPYLRLSAALLLATAVSFALRRGRFSYFYFRLSIFVVFAALGLLATRNQPQFALIAGVVLAWNVGDWLAARPLPSLIERAVARIVTSAVLVGLVLWVATGQFYAYAGEGRVAGLGEHPFWFAHDAAKFAARPEMPRHFIAYHEGQAAVFEYHMRADQRVYVDPRLEVSTRPALQQYYDLAAAMARRDDNWSAHLPAASPLGFLVDHASHHAVEAALLVDERWQCIWFDGVAGIYVPRSETRLVETHGVDFAARYFNAGRATPAVGGTNASLPRADGFFNVGRDLLAAGLPKRRDGWLLMLSAIADARAVSGVVRPTPRAAAILAGASLSLYAPPDVKSAASTWQPEVIIGVARARYFLGAAIRRAPDDFQSWLALCLIAQLLGDIDAFWGAGGRLAQLHPTTVVEFEVQRQVRGLLRQLIAVRAAEPPIALPVGESELATAVRDLIERRRFFRALDLLERSAMPVAVTSRVAAELADLKGLLSLLAGDPARARAVWSTAPLTTAAVAARLGDVEFVEGRLVDAAASYRAAVASDPSLVSARRGLALTHLELGEAAGFVRECAATRDSSAASIPAVEICRELGDVAARHAGAPPQRTTVATGGANRR